MDNQIILDFRVNSLQSLWRLTLTTLSVICSVKNMNPRKKPHQNRLTRSNARASHVLKNLFRQKSIKVVGFFFFDLGRACKSQRSRNPIFLEFIYCVRKYQNIKSSISIESSPRVECEYEKEEALRPPQPAQPAYRPKSEKRA